MSQELHKGELNLKSQLYGKSARSLIFVIPSDNQAITKP
mgnify:CR=1 FL=1